jgi:hypothetical protein
MLYFAMIIFWFLWVSGYPGPRHVVAAFYRDYQKHTWELPLLLSAVSLPSYTQSPSMSQSPSLSGGFELTTDLRCI